MADAVHAGKGDASVGTLLREAREARSLSLDEAARVTRLGKNYLVALESDEFDKLPNLAYARGFIRVYAGFLGLSADELLRRYDAVGDDGGHRSPVEDAMPAPQGKAADSISPRNRWSLPLVLLLLVVALALMLRLQDEEPSRPIETGQLTAAAPEARQPATPAPQQQLSTARQPETSPPAPADDTVAEQQAVEGNAASSPARGVILKLKINKDSWLNITIDESVSQQYDLKAGDLIEWKGERVFALDVGNAGGVEGEFNGKPLGVLGEEGKPAHLVLSADGGGD
ncbi:DUF4115 domain-containing protein [Geobacter sulfurreducens]|uniref:Helix-turn-helix domain protein n=1 Tax=Geobacter sulfurreducens (strain ATCC 51573 / DSM 12127 / PCA) TaxID=243231 RepID=Q74E49_GEOSL|nr:helix-turn-helix domain-containing protein [Geobacter sulfurreducens]AAR34441.1 helix-turn-helix domain protein [Geobacter sulfurreducens PCA]ADI83952.1 helix-turn-helix domain protein [Geobacter sulfurreducens KN400]AJY70836.1 DNA-binding protein [Geobacter sulfurreducens]UAC05156.1 DUF4115 domain-containing protein [Geobacter sulfurreducens]UTG93793.1 DUF4115 domain-containing protein [Geobacter sulfurreducens]